MFEKYKTEIIKQFAYVKENDVIGIFNNLTPAECRDYFILLYDNKKLTEDDKSVMRSFFKVNEGENLKTSINNCKISSFRPIISFLKEEKNSEHRVRINLAAILVGFENRPYSKFSNMPLREDDKNKKTTDTSSEEEIIEEKKNISSEQEDNKEDEKQPTETLFKDSPQNLNWFKKNISYIIAGVVFFILISFGMNYFLKGKGMMGWLKDHYEIIDSEEKTEKKYDFIIALDEKKLTSFKKIIPCDTTKHIKNGKACLWYGKSPKGEIEFFTALDVHPETGKTLKEVTDYIMNKYGKGPCK